MVCFNVSTSPIWIYFAVISSVLSAIPHFRDYDMTITEGERTSVTVELTPDCNISQPLFLPVYVSTLSKFKEAVRDTECGQTLEHLSLNSSIRDPAEETDLEVGEYMLEFNSTCQQQSFTLEAVDDTLSEKEEWFVVYLNGSHNQCAISISIRDNDLLKFNFSTPTVTVQEDEMTADVCVEKIGNNEPDVTFNLTTMADDSRLSGTDYNLQTEITFSTDLSRVCVPAQIHDDNITQGTNDSEITICLPDLNLTNVDVMLIAVCEPKCVSIKIIHDDALIGFANTSVVIREGTNSSLLCVKVLEGSLLLDVNLTLNLMTSMQDEYLRIHESPSFTLESENPNYCFSITTRDDSVTFNSSVFEEISLMFQPNQKMFGVILQDTLSIQILDDDVVTFLEQPATIFAVISGQAYFPCRYTGTNKVPEWNIINGNGEARQYTATTLPPFHFFNGTGLLITKVTESLNLTIHSCFFELNRAGPYKIISSSGTLVVLTPVLFEVHAEGCIEHTNDSFCYIEGIDGLIVISRSGYTNLTYAVTLESELLQGLSLEESIQNGSFVDTTYIFTPSTKEIHIPIHLIEDTVPKGITSFKISVVDPVEVVGQSTALSPAIASEAITISIYDNDYNIGFMNYSDLPTISPSTNDSTRVCVSFFHQSHAIDPRVSVHLIIREVQGDRGKLLLNPNHVSLNQSYPASCIEVQVHNSTEACIPSLTDDHTTLCDMIFTLEVLTDNSTTSNIYIQQRFTLIYYTGLYSTPTPTCDTNDLSVPAVVISVSVIVAAIIISPSLILIACCCCPLLLKEDKFQSQDNGMDQDYDTDPDYDIGTETTL